MTQDMTQVLRASKHLCHVMDNDDYSPDWQVQFYVPPYACTRSMLRKLRQCFLKKMIIDMMEELQVREPNFEKFQAQSSDLLPNLKPNNSRLPQVRSRCSPSAPAPHVHCAHYFSNLHTLFSTSLLKQIMEKQTSEQSRRERRKESRLAKNASKHQSWLLHQKSRAMKKHGNDSDSELETKSKSDTSVSPSVKEAQVEKFESYSRKYETDEEYMLSEEERGGSVAKKKKKTKGSSKSSGKSMVEMGMQLVSIAAEKDLELERKLSKKLKVKEGKLRGVDDGLNIILDGMSSAFDFIMGEGEVPGTGELSAMRLKKSLSSKKDKLSNKRIKVEAVVAVSGHVETSDEDIESDDVPDSVPSRKKHKKRKVSGQQQKDNVEDDGVGMSKPVESCGKEVKLGDAPAEVPEKKAKEKYIAPHLRARAGNEPEEHTQIRRRVRGLLNRLSESNVESITGELSLIFQSVARSVASQILTEEVLASCSSGPRGNQQYAAVFAAFVAGMACLVGVDFSAKFVASFAKCFEDEYNKEDNLSLRNLILLLSYLCIFGVCSSDLIYDFLVMVSKRLTEADVSIILTLLQCCGMKLRADDPAAMKDFILSVQNTSNKLKASSEDDNEKKNSKRMEFMLEIICDIKNNKKKPNEDSAHHTRIKKWLRKLRVDDILIRGLKWSKLLDPDKKGQWWLSGDVASSTGNVEEVANRIDKDVLETQRMLQLAAAQKMNTDARRAIFCIIMSGEDYLDAFEKLLRLELPGKQDRGIMRVLVECCLQEKVFNKYYTVLASKLCEHDKNHKFTLQFCLWDQFKDLESMPLMRSMHLAKFVAEMVASFTLSLSVLKTVDLNDITLLTPKRIMHFRILFEAILEYPENLVWNIFTRAAVTPELESFRQGLEFFIKEYIVKTNKDLTQKFKLAKRALNNVEGILM
ncbi:Nucleolar MIF4G domain-containing protein 1 [Glycine soja]|uniref:Nucleolar MIF4G domain-containing protein 1 n=2 Tax=Glycine soja TaxID=3848 RepID=A0A445FF64_GLYSO|nr:Nucleolar MIF4G domain-containing protein 1 [Glycine soja]